MNFKLLYTEIAATQREALERGNQRPWKSVKKALGLMEANLKHQSLNTHKFLSLQGSKGEEVFESYAQNNTPGAYRIFWHYGPNRGMITIVAITPHP